MDTDKTISTNLPASGKKSNKSSGFKKFFRNFFLLLVLVGGFLIYWFYFNVYSDGERKGTLIKITHKGNVFKTDEGEMWLSCRQVISTSSEKFFFSVTNDSLAKVLVNMQDECVQLSYKQYRGALPWRGDSKYIVTGVMAIKESKNIQLLQ